MSTHQGSVDWKQVAADLSNIKFAFIKATEGGSIIGTEEGGYIDPTFEYNWEESAENGILRGAYHFARISDRTGTGKYPLLEDAISEARWFWEVVSDAEYHHGADLPPVLDVEWGSQDDLPASMVLDWTLSFLNELTGLCGRKPIIYVGPNFWRYKLLKDPQLNEYPLWETDINNPMANPKAMGDWEWLFHQYSFEGAVDGIRGNVDLNVFRGTLKDLEAFIAVDDVPPLPTQPSYDPPCNLGLPTVNFNTPTYPRGEAVERIQAMLMSHGFGPDGLISRDDMLPDGIGGPKTRDAVGRFQAQACLNVDWIVGRRTWWALISKGIELT